MCTTTGASTHTACDSYTWEGQTATTSGDLTHVYTNAAGCDSTHTLTVTINNSVITTNDQTICYGESYSINGNVHTTSGLYIDSLTTADGCDSLVKTVLTVLPQFTVTATASPSATVCLGDSVTLSTLSANSNFTYQWSDANGTIVGATSSTYVAGVSGQYSLVVANSNGYS